MPTLAKQVLFCCELYCGVKVKPPPFPGVVVWWIGMMSRAGLRQILSKYANLFL